ncbi:MAG TPA: hypothetical protein VN429_03345 [Methanospirillum sp.]|uniref:hypothetical protein n=1 Tax=Methanospirillum sp. TaxID=45200 RepID=UPI002C6B6758|nr:hypothetical protein [Methanospirillum sp.]HWQ63426.1 hypothetical protein [Methanospirillum sp.]
MYFYWNDGFLYTVGLIQVTVPSLESVQEGGNYLNLIDLKGSMTIEEGATYVGMSLDEFYTMMEIPVTVSGSTRLNEVKDYVPDYDFHTMKAK